MLCTTEAAPIASAEALLSATLCLMSCAMQSGARLYLPRIATNLDQLAAHPDLSSEMRAVCRKLAAHWDSTDMAALRMQLPGDNACRH